MKPVPLENPPNPWSSTLVDYLGDPPGVELQVYEDQSRSILAHNDSPDVGFRWSLNPYRGCFHGCAYCYARPSHHYLGFGSGTDFERRIVVKPRAPELLREAFERPAWQGELIVVSGNTDCYQPLEASYQLTRSCLEVCVEYRNPIHIITKAPLIERDIELLAELHRVARVGVSVSIPFHDEKTARAIEPYVTPPARRMRTVERLAAAGIPVCVNVAPVIPGLNDRDIPAILERAVQAGASSAVMILVRLPGTVKDVFAARLAEKLPLSSEKILRRTREMRGGKLNDPRFGARMRGEGQYVESIRALFAATARRLGLNAQMRETDRSSTFRRPRGPQRQLDLFE
ncbi:MAG TPA: PA0069 family radical SAM protein [Polyangiaceae bacterium]|nr:PA0069 family radical SAM protein [Polyangiaceae bacterium]